VGRLERAVKFELSWGDFVFDADSDGLGKKLTESNSLPSERVERRRYVVSQ